MHQVIPVMPILPGFNGVSFHIVRLGGQALAYPGAFDGLLIFGSHSAAFVG